MLGFKTDKERDQYAQLAQKNPKLLSLVLDLVDFTKESLNKDVILTSVYRDADEQAALYAAAERKVIHSPHMTWEAVDLRSFIYTSDEIQKMLEYLNKKYKNPDGRVVAMYHEVPPSVYHFHVQLYRA